MKDFLSKDRLLLAGFLLWCFLSCCALCIIYCLDHAKRYPAPIDPAPAQPAPAKPAKPCPDCRENSRQKMVVNGSISPAGTEVQIDYPVDQRIKNAGGTDGAGLCVWASLGHSARWQNEKRLENIFTQMRKEKGGGWPEKVDQMIAKYAPGVSYINYQGRDPLILEKALKSGRMVAVTYNGHDPHYSGSISHMVSLVCLTANEACILDNNFVGENELVWMSRQEFIKRWGGDGGWAIIIISTPTPPPVPHN